MKIRMLPSAFGQPEYQYLTTFLVDDEVSIDAGCLGFHGGPEDQARVGHVFLTHSHADHVSSLPMFVSNVFERRAQSVVVHGHHEVLDSLRRDVFNGRIWPDFLRITNDGAPLLVLDEIVPYQVCRVGGLSLTPIPVHHPVPTVAYLIEDGMSAVVVSTDSGPTDAIWEAACQMRHLKAVFLGTAYPDEEHELARVAGHLTPRQVRAELRKLPGDLPVIAVHLKPSHRPQIVEQLAALRLDNLSVGVADRSYVL